MIGKSLLAGALALALGTPPNSTPYSDGVPPARYQGDNSAAVFFLNDVSPACGKTGDPRLVILACQGNGTIVLPNPCKFASFDWYARIACHELGHRNGWPALHGD